MSCVTDDLSLIVNIVVRILNKWRKDKYDLLCIQCFIFTIRALYFKILNRIIDCRIFFQNVSPKCGLFNFLKCACLRVGVVSVSYRVSMSVLPSLAPIVLKLSRALIDYHRSNRIRAQEVVLTLLHFRGNLWETRSILCIRIFIYCKRRLDTEREFT